MGKGRLLTYNTSSSYSAVIILHVTCMGLPGK